MYVCSASSYILEEDEYKGIKTNLYFEISAVETAGVSFYRLRLHKTPGVSIFDKKDKSIK